MFCWYFQSAYFFPCVVILHHLFVITSSFSGSTVYSRWLHWDRVWCWVLYCSHSGWWMLRSKLCLCVFFFFQEVHSSYDGSYLCLNVSLNWKLCYPEYYIKLCSFIPIFNNSPYKRTNGCEYMEIIYFNCG